VLLKRGTSFKNCLPFLGHKKWEAVQSLMIGNINQGCDIEVDLIDGNNIHLLDNDIKGANYEKLEYSKPTFEYINRIESSNSRDVQADVVYDVNYAIGQNILLAVTAIAGF